MNHSGDIGKRHTLMNKTAFFLLCLLAFLIPFSEVVELPGFGTLARAIGYAALLAALVAAAETKRHERLHGPALWAFAFVAWAALSIVWTLRTEATLERVPTFVRCLGLYWLIYEYASGEARVRKILLAYVLGCYLCMGGLLKSVGANEIVLDATDYDRYSLGMEDPNELATMLAIGIPMAWHLSTQGLHVILTWICRLYIPAAVVAVLLTGSRGGLVTAAVGLLIIPMGLRRLQLRTKIVAASFVLLIIVGTLHFVPDATLARFRAIPEELARGTLSNRKAIWQAGIILLKEHYVLGVGAGAFNEEIFDLGGFRKPKAAHNTLLGVACELGVIGAALFTGMIAVTVAMTVRLPRQSRQFCGFLLLTSLTGGITLSGEYHKATWLVLGLLGTIGARTVGAPPPSSGSQQSTRGQKRSTP